MDFEGSRGGKRGGGKLLGKEVGRAGVIAMVVEEEEVSWQRELPALHLHQTHMAPLWTSLCGQTGENQPMGGTCQQPGGSGQPV